ncbi:MAG TPA: MogA/MoaB family molybdenum cofactor biosynthesis protein [Candidatus Saccharimonadia bacterium]|nr:MogA/MoaB family molybdenum cofactor biosynthesis protein [Candidatus Saccharimonadia bacterium]
MTIEAHPTALVLTVSDGVTVGTRTDESGDRLAERLAGEGFEVERGAVPDDAAAIANAVRGAVNEHRLVITTGGTGLTTRDVTPQAIEPLLDYLVPGLAELMRAHGLRSTPHAALSRSLAGVIGRSLVLALPGSPRGALESLEAVLPVLPHALETLADDSSRHATTSPR